MTSDAALMLLQKKKALKNEIVPDLDRMIESAVAATTERTKREIEEKLANMKPREPEFTKPDSTSLFKAAETDFRTLLDQRRRMMSSRNVLAEPQAPENIYVDFSHGTPPPESAVAGNQENKT
jgi:hypothetical protein